MERCAKCLLPAGRFRVKLNELGICNYCTLWDAQGDRFGNYERNKERFLARLEKVRGKFPYDAAAGLSGGKDSTYVLYRLVHEYKLKVLAVTFDNGFLSDYAKENIQKIVESLGVDHFFHRPDWDAFKPFYLLATRKFGWPCIACSYAGYMTAVKGCFERRIPFFIHGRSPFQMFKNLYPGTRDFSLDVTGINLEEHSFAKLARKYKRIDLINRVFLFSQFRDRRTRNSIYYEFFRPRDLAVTEEFTPEFFGYFLTEPYDEEGIKAFLETRGIGYKRPVSDARLGHGDCEIHDACAYLYQKKNRVSLEFAELAVMLRQGLIDIVQAEEILRRNEPTQDSLERSIAALCERLSFSRNEFNEIAASLEKRGKRFWGH